MDQTNETTVAEPALTQEQMIAEIHQMTKQTRSYMRWQIYIILVLVVLPLLAALIVLPLALKSLTNTYETQQIQNSQ